MKNFSVPPKRSFLKPLFVPPPVKIVILYVIIGSLWILLSDKLLLFFVHDISSLSFLQTIKGWVYVLVTAGFLYFLIRSDFSTIQSSQEALKESYDATLLGWVHTLDLRDKETEGHTKRVTELTQHLAREMGMSEADLEHVRRGALLHDVGKIGVPDRILLKPDALTDEEWKIMRKHTDYVYELLSPILYLRPALDIPYCHHEKWDGSGYPRGLKGEQIPLAARIFAVADVWDALQFDRPYRKAWPEQKIREYIREQSGKHFDPQVVAVFLRLINKQ
jgi:putative nucleotidyltransferase with HDIG domain